MTDEYNECLLQGAVFQPLYNVICPLLAKSDPLKTLHNSQNNTQKQDTSYEMFQYYQLQ